ncbi:MAG: WS/DGAT domain-containing protein, partial [Acidobacteriota bacterium]
PYVPIAYSLGLGIATLSYHEDLCLGLTSDRQAFPDALRMRDLLLDSYERLREAARAAMATGEEK